MVEHSATDPKIRGSNLVAIQHQEVGVNVDEHKVTKSYLVMGFLYMGE